MAEQENKGPTGPMWMDGALHGWILPVAGILIVGAVAGLYFLGVIGDQVVGELIAAAFVVVLAFIALKAGLEAKDPKFKTLSLVYSALFLFVALYPTTKALMPGKPAAESTLTAEGQKMDLPGPGSYRLLVHAPLHEGGEARVSYELKSGNGNVDGTLERTYSYRRVRRGGAMRVAEDHDFDAHEITVGSPAQLELGSLRTDNRSGATLTVRAYPILPPWVLWAAMALVVIAGAFLEAKLLAKGALAMTGVAAICFALLIDTANPSSALGPVLGSALLGAGGGALGGSLTGWIGKKLFPAAEPAKGFKGARAAKDAEGKGSKGVEAKAAKTT